MKPLVSFFLVIVYVYSFTVRAGSRALDSEVLPFFDILKYMDSDPVKARDLYFGIYREKEKLAQLTDRARSLMVERGLLNYHFDNEQKNQLLSYMVTWPQSLQGSNNRLARRLYRQVLSGVQKKFIAPVIEPKFLRQKDLLVKTCQFSSLDVGGLGSYLLAGDKSPIPFEELVKRATQQSGFKYKPLVKTDLIKESLKKGYLDHQQSLPVGFDCEKLIDDLFQVLHPYCVDFPNMKNLDSNECTAINLPLAQELVQQGSWMTYVIRDLLIQISKKSDKQNVDLWKWIEEGLIRHQPSLTEKTREHLAFLLLTSLANDNEVPYFLMMYMEILYANNQRDLAETLWSSFADDGKSLKESAGVFVLRKNKTLQSLLVRVGKWLNGGSTQLPFVGRVKRAPYSSGLHHFIAGAYTSYKLKEKGYSDEAALWAAHVAGASYEFKDLIGHIYQDSQLWTQNAKNSLASCQGRDKSFYDSIEMDFVKEYESFEASECINKDEDTVFYSALYLKRAAQIQLETMKNFEVDSLEHLKGGEFGVQFFWSTK